MKKSPVTLVLAVLVLLTVGWFALPKKEVRASMPPIEYFRFSYYGTERYALQDYTLEEIDGNIRVILDGENEFRRHEQIVAKRDMDKLHALLESHDVMAWDGFSGSDSNVLDGYSFHLEIRYKDGSQLYASGSNAYPSGFGTVHKALIEFFETYESRQ